MKQMTSTTGGIPVAKKKNPMSTFLLFLSMGLVVFLITPAGQAFRTTMGRIAGYALDPIIGFGANTRVEPGVPGHYPIVTILLASVILVEGAPKDIVSRRNGDPTRARDPDTEDDIAAHQAFNRAAAMTVGVLTGATIAIVMNKQGDVDGTRDQILRILG